MDFLLHFETETFVGSVVGLLLIDLNKAFDTVNHSSLFSKLETYGVKQNSDTELNWFKSYFSNREIYTNYKGVNSTTRSLEIGVPQGSCLATVMFTIYVNDLYM